MSNMSEVLSFLNKKIEQGEVTLCDPLPRTKEYCERVIRKLNEHLKL